MQTVKIGSEIGRVHISAAHLVTALSACCRKDRSAAVPAAARSPFQCIKTCSESREFQPAAGETPARRSRCSVSGRLPSRHARSGLAGRPALSAPRFCGPPTPAPGTRQHVSEPAAVPHSLFHRELEIQDERPFKIAFAASTRAAAGTGKSAWCCRRA